MKTLNGIAPDRFCSDCRPRVVEMLASGQKFVDLCEECSVLVSRSPIYFMDGTVPPPNPNPAPWKLLPVDFDDQGWIEDANGKVICAFGHDAMYDKLAGEPPDEPAATLILAAPELENLLREVHDTMRDGMKIQAPPEELRARIRTVLDRIDAARKKNV